MTGYAMARPSRSRRYQTRSRTRESIVEVPRVVLEPVAQLVARRRSRGSVRGSDRRRDAPRRPGGRAAAASSAARARAGDASYSRPTCRMRAIGTLPRRKTSSRSRLATLLGMRSELPSIVRTLIARHESCSTSPIVSPARTMSPTWTVRSIASAMPEKRLPSVSWSASPRTAVMMAEVVSSAGRLTERTTLKRTPRSRPKTRRLTSWRRSSGAGVSAPQPDSPTSKRTKSSESRDDEQCPGDPDGELAVVLRAARIGQRDARAVQERDHARDDGEEQERRQDAPRRRRGWRRPGAHRAAILCDERRAGRPLSWKRRIAAMPQIRSRVRARARRGGPRRRRRWRRRRGRALASGGSARQGRGAERRRRSARLEGVSKIGPITTRSAPAAIASLGLGARSASRRRRESRAASCARTRETGRPSDGRWTPSAPAASATSNRRWT